VDLKREIERVINEMGFLAKKKSTVSKSHVPVAPTPYIEKNEGDDDAVKPLGPHEIASSLTALRYQLFKMQQELLRRQVLDSKHYKATGFDNVSHEHNGLTVIDTDPTNGNFYSMSNLSNANAQGSGSPIESKGPLAIGQNELKLQEINIPTSNGFKRSIEFVYDTVAEKLLGRLVKEPLFSAAGEAEKMASSFKKLNEKRKRESSMRTAFVVVSNLVFNLMTEHSIEHLLEGNNEEKAKMLRSIYELMLKKVNELPEPKVSMTAVSHYNLFVDANFLTNRGRSRSRSTECSIKTPTLKMASK
jgi:hypothetical protein